MEKKLFTFTLKNMAGVGEEQLLVSSHERNKAVHQSDIQHWCCMSKQLMNIFSNVIFCNF